MNKRALVIGSEVLGLKGVENDARAMRDELVRRGFAADAVELRFKERATRAGILEGLKQLIEQSQDGDLAVVYYSGHGQYTPSSDGEPRRFQALVPTDWSETTAQDYRGISTWELSCNLARLTRKTRNAVLILDCCHAAMMCRDGITRHATVRALPSPRATSFTAHVEAVRALYPDVATTVMQAGWSNPDLVRLVASGRTESAHELQNAQNVCRGVFSEALIELMSQADDGTLTWAALGQAVRERVLREFPSQRPDLEGPMRRRLFSLVEDDGHGGIPIVPLRSAKHGHYLLRAGRLAGVSTGDVYSVMPHGSTEIVPAKEIARVLVVSAAATTSEALVKDWRNHHTAMLPDAVALPRELMAPRRAVQVIAPPQARTELEKELTGTLRAARPDERERALATLRLEGELLTVEDAHGPMFPALRYPAGVKETMARLVELGVAQGLRELQGDGGITERQISIGLGVLHEGKPVPLPDRGAELGTNDRLFIALRNHGQRRLYAHVFNLGVNSQVTLLSDSAVAGLVLDARQRHVLGENEATGEIEGLRLLWPRDLPATGGPRLDEIIVIVTTKQIDLRRLEARQPQHHGARLRGGGTPLQDQLAQLQDGQSRDVGTVESDPFLIKRLSYFLDPREISLSATAASYAAAVMAQTAAESASSTDASAGAPASPAAPAAPAPRSATPRSPTEAPQPSATRTSGSR